MIRPTLSAVMLFSLIALAPPGAASAQTTAQRTTTAATNAATNRVDAKQVGITRAAIEQHVQVSEPALATIAVAQRQSQSGRGRTLMIVGGAAFLAGLIIGDDAGNAIAIGGALVGIYGLYLWAQTQ